METIDIQIDGDAGGRVSGLLLKPRQVRACYVFGHGAGAGMSHPWMEDVAAALAARSIATLRYNFPYRERGGKRPDSPGVCHATVRAAVAVADATFPKKLLIAGGKSFGARMTSQAQADMPLPGIRGLVFFGFPLHPAGRPAVSRAAHLDRVKVPMLFLQGTRDGLAEVTLVKSVVESLGECATLLLAEGADHSLQMPKRSERGNSAVLEELLNGLDAWLARLA